MGTDLEREGKYSETDHINVVSTGIIITVLIIVFISNTGISALHCLVSELLCIDAFFLFRISFHNSHFSRTLDAYSTFVFLIFTLLYFYIYIFFSHFFSSILLRMYISASKRPPS